MLASDVNNPQYSGAIDPDSVMKARFYKKAVRQNFESEKQGKPVFLDVIYCEYSAAGDTKNIMDVPAQEFHKQRFAKQWAYYETTQGGDAREMGTPLSEWSLLSPADVENLRGQKFFTVEHIAGASDQLLQSMGMGVASMSPFTLRARAQGFLGSAKDSAFPQQQAVEIADLKKKLEELTALVSAAPAPKAKGGAWTAERRAAQSAKMKARHKGKQDGVNTTPAS